VRLFGKQRAAGGICGNDRAEAAGGSSPSRHYISLRCGARRGQSMGNIALDLFLGVQTGSVFLFACDGETAAVAGCSNASWRNLVAHSGRKLSGFKFSQQLHTGPRSRAARQSAKPCLPTPYHPQLFATEHRRTVAFCRRLGSTLGSPAVLPMSTVGSSAASLPCRSGYTPRYPERRARNSMPDDAR
jgi:hypothetical protein